MREFFIELRKAFGALKPLESPKCALVFTIFVMVLAGMEIACFTVYFICHAIMGGRNCNGNGLKRLGWKL